MQVVQFEKFLENNNNNNNTKFKKRRNAVKRLKTHPTMSYHNRNQ